MRLQKQLSRKVADKEYAKYVITISPKQIEELGWKEGEELDGRIRGDHFIIARKKDSKSE